MSANATVYHGRAEDVLPELARGCADLVVMDPPYGVKFLGNRGKNFDPILNDDGTLDMADVLAKVCRCLRSDRHIYQFGGLGFGDAPVGARSSLVWDKVNIGMGNLAVPWGPQHEVIDFGIHQGKAAMKRGDGNLSARLRKGNILRACRPNGTGVNRHPTEKPVALLKMLIESSSCAGDTVLDPFLGSGSTAVAAILLGRKCIGVELDPQYLPVAVARIKAAEALAAAMAAA